MGEIKLSEREAKALTAWFDTDPDMDIMSFAVISRRSGLPRGDVRRTVRALARKNMTTFVKGVWSDDGRPGGAGYGLTPAGRSFLNAQKGESRE